MFKRSSSSNAIESGKKPSLLGNIPKFGGSFPSLNTASASATASPTLVGATTKRATCTEDQLFKDINQVRIALDYFFNSNIADAEAILKPHYKDKMYYSLGYSFILYLKSVMTFQQDDIDTTLDVLKHTIQISNSLKKKESSWVGSLANWVKGTTVEDVKNMTTVERHAELIHAEAYLLKALLSVILDESIVSFLRESLHIKSSYGTYTVLQKFIESASPDEQSDGSLASGVYLGVGCFNLILSILPSSVIKVAEFIGFSSDRKQGLVLLEKVGGWDSSKSDQRSENDPSVNNTIRRQMCDMVLIVYHVILSKLVPLSDVNAAFAEIVINESLCRYPNGVFFRYFNGRLMSGKRLLKEAEEQYKKAIDSQKDWKQLEHMCFWELGLIYLMRHEWKNAYEAYTLLAKESKWSTIVYTYLKAVSLYMLSLEGHEDEKKQKSQAVECMKDVLNMEKKKATGKSIPMEKFVARKAKKFLSQNNYLLLPDLEVLNAFTAFDFMPVDVLQKDMKRIETELISLNGSKKIDDLCLAQFLRAITARGLYEQNVADKQELHTLHAKSLQFVFDNEDKIQLEHYIYFYSHYEKACMYMADKDYKQAEVELNIVLKASENNKFTLGSSSNSSSSSTAAAGHKAKYSLGSALVFKCHNCITKIKAESKQAV